MGTQEHRESGLGLPADDVQLCAAGESMMSLVRDLYPMHRSITGAGLRDTIGRLGELLPLDVVEVPSGTRVFDWTVPPEWSISEGYLESAEGHRVVDFRDSNLHVMAYSQPIDSTLTLEELRPHLHTLPEHPDWVPFRSSYYRDDWAFCLSDRVASALRPGMYRAVIRSQFKRGAMTLAEFVHRGENEDEVLVFTHTCHPSLCNDNLSGIAVVSHLAEFLRKRKTRYTYRFVFAPATIGSISWLALNESRLDKIRHGLVVAMVGDSSPLRYKASRAADCAIDRAAREVLRSHNADGSEVPFSPWGFDERQFATPGINLPVGRITRALPGEFPNEHTSADDLAFISAHSLGESWLACLRIFDVLERDRRFINLQPKGEPQLGSRGLYRLTGGHYSRVPERQLALLWVLNQSDGRTSLLDIAERSDLPFEILVQAAVDLMAVKLLALAGDTKQT